MRIFKIVLIVLVLLIVLYLVGTTGYVLYKYYHWPSQYHRPERVADDLKNYVFMTGSVPKSLKSVYKGELPTYTDWSNYVPYEYRRMVIDGREYGFAVTTTDTSGYRKAVITPKCLRAAAKTGKTVVEYEDQIVVIVVGPKQKNSFRR